MRVFYVILLVLCSSAAGTWSDELQAFKDCRLVDHPANDGDSFMVRTGSGSNFMTRLYYVDCPEKHPTDNASARRTREQARYFGLSDPRLIPQLGAQAAREIGELLSEPFTVYTAFADARGSVKGGRVYAFVTTAGGQDAAATLVASGWARAIGVGRATPGGTPQAEMKAVLADREAAAMLSRRGVWEHSDPDRITELRAAQRAEDRELADIFEEDPPEQPVDINRATVDELQRVPGLGPALSGRIIEGRPFGDLDELLEVSGIGTNNLEDMRPWLRLRQ